MSSWHEVACLDDLWEGDLLEVSVAGDAILLAHLTGGVVRAYQGECPHARFPLASGELAGDVLTCAGHGWEFDLRTGQGVNPDNCRLRRFPVRVDGEQISVSVSGVPA
jgi:toluene monooxygenase system ferredoxin subunit